MLGDVGRSGDVVLVARDEDAVLRGDEVRLDVVRAHGDRELVRGQRVLGPIAARAAVPDHDRVRVLPELRGSVVGADLRGRDGAGRGGEDDEADCERPLPGALHGGDLLGGLADGIGLDARSPPHARGLRHGEHSVKRMRTPV
jgi:hypothetical protein